MRNILEYPITVEDKIAALEWAIKLVLQDQGVGGVQALALSEVLSDLRNSAAQSQNRSS
jgi:hypothetical protein